MRKNYQKPELYAEAFRLVEHISGICEGGTGYEVKHNTAWTCKMIDGDSNTYFMDNTVACNDADYPLVYESDEVLNMLLENATGVCYNTSYGGPMYSS